MSVTSLNISSADSIDYGNAHEICGYQMLLCKMFENAGGFDLPSVSDKKTLAIRREGMTWLRNVKDIIEGLLSSPIDTDESDRNITLGDIPGILGSYDLLYRVCHGGTCFDFIRDIRFRAANRWARGDKSISETEIALMLCKEINRDIRKIEQRYLDFSGRVMTSWTEDLRTYGRLRGLTFKDAYHVLDFLLKDDLFAFGVRKEDKLRWIRVYILTESEIDRLDVDNLWAYMIFEQTASFLYGKSSSEQEDKYVRFLSKIHSHPETNRLIRETLSLELAKHQIV